MSGLRYVPIDWIRAEEQAGAWEIVARELGGRVTCIPLPGVKLSVEALANLVEEGGFRILKVEVHDAASPTGGSIHLRRWFRTRTVSIHAALAVSLAVRYGADLWLDEHLFTLATGRGDSLSVDREPGGLVH